MQQCAGCYRTLEEIAGWSTLDIESRRNILAALPERKAFQALASQRCSAKNPTQAGFTVVELLVSLAVIGIVMALLLPAISSARESVRRASCMSNLRQIGIAINEYHDAYRTLPTGCIEWRGFNTPRTNRQYAWSALILPFLDERPLHSKINFHRAFDAPENAQVAATRVKIFECPSVPRKKTKRGPSDYGGLYGELINDREQDDGLFLYDTVLRLIDVTDGTTHTLAVAEDVDGPDSEWINGRNVFIQAYGINDKNAWIGDNEIRSKHRSGAMVVFVDSRTQFMSEAVRPLIVGQLITRTKGEIINQPEYAVH